MQRKQKLLYVELVFEANNVEREIIYLYVLQYYFSCVCQKFQKCIQKLCNKLLIFTD